MIIQDIQTHLPGQLYSNDEMIEHLQWDEMLMSELLEDYGIGERSIEDLRNSPTFFQNLGVESRHILCDVGDRGNWMIENEGTDPFALEAAKAYEKLMEAHPPLKAGDRLIVIGNGVDTISPHIGYATVAHLQSRNPDFVAPSTIAMVGEGCSGFISGLREAGIYMKACPGSRAVVLTVEMMATPLLNTQLFSGIREVADYLPSEDLRRMITGLAIQRYLFGDGCAAAICTTEDTAGLQFESYHKWANLDPEDRHMLELIGTNTKGYPSLPPFGFFYQDPKRLFGRLVSDYLPKAFEQLSQREQMPQNFAIHTGSGKILDFIQEGFGLSAEQVEPSRHILRTCGNMNATTGAAILAHLMDEGMTDDVAAMFFGVGFALQLAY